MKFDYDGNNRRGLTARSVSPLRASGGRYLAAFRKWRGLAPHPRCTRARTVQQTVVTPPDLGGPIELVVLSVKRKSERR